MICWSAQPESENWHSKPYHLIFNYCTSLVSPKGNQSWIFIGKTETEAEAPVLWPPDNDEPTH